METEHDSKTDPGNAPVTPEQWYEVNRLIGYSDGLVGLYLPESVAQARFGYDEGHKAGRIEKLEIENEDQKLREAAKQRRAMTCS